MEGFKVTAYRVQAADGRGPWRPGWSHTWIDDAAPPDRLTETVMNLVPIHLLMNLPKDMAWGSACRSFDALMQWFTPVERQRLQVAGYHPVKLMADVVLAESAWQMLIGRRRPFTDGATRLRWP
jgi:hypothetical protein